MKRCRMCGRDFPDSYSFCDQDASALPPARPRRTRSTVAAIGAVAVLVAIAAAAAPGEFRRYIRSHVAIDVTGVSFAHAAFSWPPGNVELQLRVHNRSPLSPSLRSLRLTCSVLSGSSIALEWPPADAPVAQGLEIRANQDTDLVLKVSPQHLDPESILSGLQEPAGTVCRGPAAFSLWDVAFSQEIEFERKL